jgi:hypothetical protein
MELGGGDMKKMIIKVTEKVKTIKRINIFY